MIVLDTHIWHWWTNQIPDKLSFKIIALIEETDEIAVSAISCFEMAWLVRHGRINLDMPFEHWFSEVECNTGIQILPVTAQIGIQAVALPEHHKDPQDRIIIATALLYEAHLLSFDTAFSAYRELDGCLIGS
ncbi:MAG: type II toxin-antitoxin system VapC family toxin [Methylovulum sp.]|nr:type II toxin-antitoxin system VapC family toxin [Methylovulum sp.]